MAHGREGNWADVPPGQDSPLNHAVTAQDQATIEMVAEAIRHREVLLAYQPVVQADRPNAPAFYEALIRILDATGRIIPAKDFIGAVESTELGREIDCLALEMGLRTLSDEPGLRLSINMSARSIGYPRWIQSLDHGLRRDPTVGERLILEITERSAMQVPELVVRFMSDLQSRGITFALDDFGAGYTAFRYLRDFYFDMIKIDGQFIRGVHDNPDNQVLTRALVAIAQQFDMVTVAEFVENVQDATWLAENGVDFLQGYFFAAPTTRAPWHADAPRPAERRQRTG
ncbi:MAG: EAL domain-containing protein [Sediminimonas qiaohouensis]|uniref:EAL domain-containing protein n=1 Tax=Sediminimonas qiaohouensis TaxID=552061 RepID=A0A7C9L6U1_9RHOB|nr:EAL domain-containing protein [Sediminimonas qiaohouensis]MTJ03675.1 EAL domain-containing protein [Sediminimonas qiaohouensis]